MNESDKYSEFEICEVCEVCRVCERYNKVCGGKNVDIYFESNSNCPYFQG